MGSIIRKNIPYNTFLKWQNRRHWLYPSNLIDSSSQWPPLNHEKWNKLMRSIDEISKEQIECELTWDQFIINLEARRWIDQGKVFFKSPYDGKNYDIRDALIIQKEKSEVEKLTEAV